MRLERSTHRKHFSITKNVTLRVALTAGAVIFLLACGVRLLSWHDTRLEVGKVQTAVTADYKRVAQLIRDGGLKSFFSSTSPLADLNNLGHPPGYSILWAWLRTSDTAIQFLQIIGDAIAAVLIFLIVAEVVSVGAGVVSGLLAACSPQLTWNSVLLLPDSISVLPILFAVLLIARAVKNPRALTFLLAGMLVGISCWLRANAMLLPLFMAAAVLLLSRQRDTSGTGTSGSGDNSAARGWRFALALVCGALLIVLPLTIRNAVVFHRLIPLSLGAGQTLLEGIADYDQENKFGIPRTDLGIMKQESELYQRPDYYGLLFNPDGVERERARLRRGFSVIGAHPFWFATVMVRRASSMLRLERARLISTQPAFSHPLQPASNVELVLYPYTMLRDSNSPLAQVRVDQEEGGHSGVLTIVGNNSRYGEQAEWPLSLQPNSDYLMESVVKAERGRMRISIMSGGATLSSTVIDALEDTKPEAQPYAYLQMAFVSGNAPMRIVVTNEASDVPNPTIKIAPLSFSNLGSARFLWTRYPRLVIHGIQKLFLTAVMLPLAIIGLLLLIWQQRGRALVILSIVPLYYFLVQSIMHTEYRYVLAVDYFLFAFAGVTLCVCAGLMKRFFLSLGKRA